MYTNRYKYFRWTPRTAWINFVYVVAVPSAVAYLGWATDVSLSLPWVLATVDVADIVQEMP